MVDVFGKKMQSRYKYESADPDILVGEKLDLDIFGLNSYIIHSLGHSKGSMCIIIDDDGIALVGDTMFGVFGNSIFPPFADDVEIMIENWKKLLETGCKLFLSGHGKVISRELLGKQYIKHKM